MHGGWVSSARVRPRSRDERPAGLVLEVELVPGRDLRGSIRRLGERRSVPFHGWIDFMAAVSVLREGDGDADR
jgi:hypothetical protein